MSATSAPEPLELKVESSEDSNLSYQTAGSKFATLEDLSSLSPARPTQNASSGLLIHILHENLQNFMGMIFLFSFDEPYWDIFQKRRI